MTYLTVTEQRISRYIGAVPSVATRGHSGVGLPAPMYCFLRLLVGTGAVGCGEWCGRYSWLKKKKKKSVCTLKLCHLPFYKAKVATLPVARFLRVLGENVGEKGRAQSPSAWWLSSSVDGAGADIWRAAAVDCLSIV